MDDRPLLASFGLEKAIRAHSENIRQAQPDLHIILNLMPDNHLLPEQVSLVLYRIYQVALTNVVRHARAGRVNVSLRLDSDSVTLEVQDDGCGFHLTERWIEMARSGHLGLVGAFERADAVGGTLEVHSQVGEGTLVRVVIPSRAVAMQNQPPQPRPGS